MQKIFTNEELATLAVNENYEGITGKISHITYRSNFGRMSRQDGHLVATQCASGRMRIGFMIHGYEYFEVVSEKGEVNTGIVTLEIN